MSHVLVQITINKRSSAMSTFLSLGLASIAGTVFSGTGCGGALGGECVIDSDCNADLICAYQFCHIPCMETRDCDVAGGEECFMSHETDKDPYNYCMIPIACAGNAECGDSRECAEDKKCRDACFQDGDCLGDQRCYQGGCRNVSNPPKDWNQPAGLGALCSIPSDCASKNCNGVCVGCTEDIDCGGIRTCDATELNGVGMCLGGIGKLNATVIPVELGDLRTGAATPNSDGSIIYFVASKPPEDWGLYKIPIVQGTPSGAPSAICTNLSPFNAEAGSIAVSSDDKFLFLTGTTVAPSSIAKIGADSSACAGVESVAWPVGVSADVLTIHPQNGIDTLYVLSGSGIYSGGALWIADVYAADVAVGGTGAFLLSKKGQIGKVDEDTAISVLVPDADLGLWVYGTRRRIALNLAGDTAYVATSTMATETIIATKLLQAKEHQQYTLPSSAGTYVDIDLTRAQKKDVFSWVTFDGRLWLFEPQ